MIYQIKKPSAEIQPAVFAIRKTKNMVLAILPFPKKIGLHKNAGNALNVAGIIITTREKSIGHFQLVTNHIHNNWFGGIYLLADN